MVCNIDLGYFRVNIHKCNCRNLNKIQNFILVSAISFVYIYTLTLSSLNLFISLFKFRSMIGWKLYKCIILCLFVMFVFVCLAAITAWATDQITAWSNKLVFESERRTYSGSLLWQQHHHRPTWISFATFHSHWDRFKYVGLWDSWQARCMVLVHTRSRYQSLTTPVILTYIRKGYVRDLLVKTSRTSMMYHHTCLSPGITMRSTSSSCHVIRAQPMTAKSPTPTCWCKYFTRKFWIFVYVSMRCYC